MVKKVKGCRLKFSLALNGVKCARGMVGCVVQHRPKKAKE